jgi:hypothetical protein
MKLAVIFNPNKFSGKLTKLFTGCYAYHVAWVDEASGKMWDMNLIRRRREWPHYADENVLLFDAPGQVNVEYLEHRLETDDNTYGWRDYVMFALRPLFHLVGKSTPNAGGVICSEMVNDDIWMNGGRTPWPPEGPPPSPCDLYQFLSGRQVRPDSFVEVANA